MRPVCHCPLVTMAPSAQAADYTLTIKDRKFSPTELKVPANKRAVITVVNDDITPEEFESKELRVAKIIGGKSKGRLLHTLIVYIERPTRLQLAAYVGTLLAMYVLMRIARRNNGSRFSA